MSYNQVVSIIGSPTKTTWEGVDSRSGNWNYIYEWDIVKGNQGATIKVYCNGDKVYHKRQFGLLDKE